MHHVWFSVLGIVYVMSIYTKHACISNVYMNVTVLTLIQCRCCHPPCFFQLIQFCHDLSVTVLTTKKTYKHFNVFVKKDLLLFGFKCAHQLWELFVEGFRVTTTIYFNTKLQMTNGVLQFIIDDVWTQHFRTTQYMPYLFMQNTIALTSPGHQFFYD